MHVIKSASVAREVQVGLHANGAELPGLPDVSALILAHGDWGDDSEGQKACAAGMGAVAWLTARNK